MKPIFIAFLVMVGLFAGGANAQDETGVTPEILKAALKHTAFRLSQKAPEPPA
jgi:hypothetical protein